MGKVPLDRDPVSILGIQLSGHQPRFLSSSTRCSGLQRPRVLSRHGYGKAELEA
jgi:hypothetical protein